ncbi:hypothetical protein SAMN04488020_101734 [Palleronia marisminoris]|uniref:Uncharacterized protein n=2 Tax=Palleronia marisminoris TaxID=315423 RepID=A0A1Y5RNV7_9RHOB|nr:hypothetical protein SAMN04488020_101734 [Palleronia marisminoris]SLN20868.1 hypothetical protein PAM7066_00736 [Palleronia marisminoris]
MGDQFLDAKAAPDFYCDELARKLLVQPFPLAQEAGHSYWPCYAERRRNILKNMTYRGWLA